MFDGVFVCLCGMYLCEYLYFLGWVQVFVCVFVRVTCRFLCVCVFICVGAYVCSYLCTGCYSGSSCSCYFSVSGAKGQCIISGINITLHTSLRDRMSVV